MDEPHASTDLVHPQRSDADTRTCVWARGAVFHICSPFRFTITQPTTFAAGAAVKQQSSGAEGTVHPWTGAGATTGLVVRVAHGEFDPAQDIEVDGTVVASQDIAGAASVPDFSSPMLKVLTMPPEKFKASPKCMPRRPSNTAGHEMGPGWSTRRMRSLRFTTAHSFVLGVVRDVPGSDRQAQRAPRGQRVPIGDGACVVWMVDVWCGERGGGVGGWQDPGPCAPTLGRELSAETGPAWGSQGTHPPVHFA